jgi:dihydroorotate dehydrogenase (NAD+) catalytic subunit
LKAVHDVSGAVPVPIIGAGGIMDHGDAISFFMAGARAIQVGTATFVDPYAIPRIIKGIEGYLKEEKYRNIDAVVGITRH